MEMSSSASRVLFVVCAVACLAGVCLVPARGAPAAEALCKREWAVSRHLGSATADAVAVGAGGVWVVGESNGKGLVLRFANGRWKSSLVATPTGDVAALTGVATGPAGVWATGAAFHGNTLLPWVLRLDGGRVTRVRLSGLPRMAGGLTFEDVAVVGHGVWLVGGYENTRDFTDDDGWLIAYGDGTRWRVSWANTTGEDELRGVSALGAGDVWAVGRTGPTIASEEEVILRWNGRGWTPFGRRLDTVALDDVVAVAESDAWAVGEPRMEGVAANEIRPVIEHWDGSEWSRVPVGRSVAAAVGTLRSLAAFGPRDVWAAGGRSGHPAVLHWDGRAWRMAPAPPTTAPILGLAASRDGTLWAVGAGFVARSTCR